MVRHLIGGHEADTKATDILAARQLTAAADIRDPVVVALVVALGEKSARLVQISAIGELAAVAHKQAVVRDVKYDLLGFRVIRILDELQRHHVVALQPGQVASDVAKEVGGVRTRILIVCFLIHASPYFRSIVRPHSMRLFLAPQAPALAVTCEP